MRLAGKISCENRGIMRHAHKYGCIVRLVFCQTRARRAKDSYSLQAEIGVHPHHRRSGKEQGRPWPYELI